MAVLIRRKTMSWEDARGMEADTPLKVLCFGFVAE
jgi:hypothetical protein